jgi:hypothetical protein
MSVLGRRTVSAAAVIALLAAMLGLSLSSSFSPVARGQGPTVSLDPSSANVDLDDTVDVAVVISGVTSLFGAHVELTFDATNLQVVDSDPSHDGIQITPGSFPGPWLEPGIVTLNAVHNDEGRISYDFTLVDAAPPADGSGVLAYIRFQGIAVGDGAIAFETADLWGPTLDDPIDCTNTGGMLTVAQASTDTPQPTPTSASTATRVPTGTPRETNTPAPTRTAKPTNTPRPTATPKNTATPKPPQEKPESTKAAVAAAGAQPTPSGGALPSAGTGGMPEQMWRWFFLSGAVVMGLATWAFTFRFYARQKENERFWHR